MRTREAAVDPYRSAVEAWLQALDLNPQFSDVLYNIGAFLHRAGHSAMAQSLWTYVVELDPDFRLALYNLGAMAYQSGDLERAGEMWDRCLQSTGADGPWPLRYDLFHLITDSDRTKTSLAPAEPAPPLHVKWLELDWLMTAMAQRVAADRSALCLIDCLPYTVLWEVMQRAGWSTATAKLRGVSSIANGADQIRRLLRTALQLGSASNTPLLILADALKVSAASSTRVDGRVTTTRRGRPIPAANAFFYDTEWVAGFPAPFRVATPPVRYPAGGRE